MALIDIEHKWLQLFIETPWDEGSWFFGLSVFRHRWEIGFTRDWHKAGRELFASAYYVYLTRFNSDGLRKAHYQIFTENRRSYVIPFL
jgi:hypothetical protein